MRIFGSISRLVSILFRKDGYDITVRPNQATTYTAARDIQLPEGDAAHELVGTAAAQTLTNKTLGTGSSIDADVATITNIADADIKAAAAIAATKIADGSVDNTEFQRLGTATNLNTVDTLVLRDGSGNFSAGTITATLSGNASTATSATTAGNVTGIVAPANGGTGANNTLSGSRVIVSNGSSQMVEAAAITVQRALVSDASGYPVASSVTDAELAYVSGVTSAVQTQLDNKASIAYVDSLAAGLDPKASVRAATTAALPACTYNNGTGGVGATLTGDSNGALSAQDGITLTSGDRLLVKNQAAALQNGIYTLTTVGSGGAPFVLTRATDMDGSPASEISGGAFTFVEAGTAQAGYGYTLVNDGDVNVGTGPINFTQFSAAGAYTGGTGITITGSSIATNDAQIVHDNLSGFVANEHVDHSSVSITTAADSGLSGGGTIAATRSLVIDPSNAPSVAAAATDQILIADASDSNALKRVSAQSIADLAAGSAAQSFTWTDGSATKSCSHTFATKVVLVEVYDENDITVYVDSVDRTDVNTVVLDRLEATVGGNWTVVIRN